MSLSLLKDQTLFHEHCFINGSWLSADNGTTVDVVNPATGQSLGTVPFMGTIEAERAVLSAAAAFPAWREQTTHERSAVLRRWYELLIRHQEDLALLMTLEQGKPLSEARGEILYAASFIEWFAEEGKRTYGDIIPPHHRDSRVLVLKEPIGVCAAITPWNFPSAMITRKAAPALAAGCTIIIKPASATPYSALALAELASRAGVPDGVINVVTGSSHEIGRVLTNHPLVRKLTFTGSTEVGKRLLAECSGTVKKVSMELGGNAPFIVFDDADLDAAVAGAIASKYRNTGQTCVCTNRFLIHNTIYDQFSTRFSAAVAKMTVGNGLEPDAQLGPLINMAAVENVERQVADAVAHGANIAVGGKRHQRGGTFFQPTVLLDATADMLIAGEETFGPVAPLFRFSTDQEALTLANDTRYGLAAYVYGRDISRLWRIAEALEYGIVGVNTGLISTAVAPFGGVKESGIGREGSRYGIDEFLEIKYVCLGGITT